MEIINEIRWQLTNGNFYFSHHAFKRIIERNISDSEIMEIGSNAIIIEEYSSDKYAPSCLILGITKEKRPLHLQIMLSNSYKLKIITLYEPDKDRWINNFTERKNV